MAIRVHKLAKELGVKSKAILEKCQAEGLEVKNHMSILSAGLEATVREWFSEGAHTTTQETTERVNLEKVRTKRKVKKKKKEEEPEETAEPVPEEAQQAEAPTPVAGAEDPGVAPEAQESPAVEEAPAAPVAETTEDVVAEAPVEAAPEPSAPVAEAAPEVKEEEPEQPEAPEEPEETIEPLKPVGQVHVPEPAALQGPRVVRVEEPERLTRPAPRRSPPIPQRPTGPSVPELPVDTGGKKGKRGRPTASEEAAEKAKKARARANPRRRRGSDGTEQLKEWRERDLLERSQRLAAAKDRPHIVQRAEAKGSKAGKLEAKEENIQLTEPVVLKDFCSAVGMSFNRIFPKLIELGIPATINQSITGEQAQMIGMALDIELEIVQRKSHHEEIIEQFANRPTTDQAARAPIVTFLGHVDHGKTSLLDKIRNTRTVDGEAGGITQAVGAYRYKEKDLDVVFLDTPGHEAFTAMRARGAQMTDIVVLVVAADDGVMPQTVEAISHAKAADVPIVVALNKIDLPNSDTNKIFGQLSDHQLVPSEWGGDIDVIRTSAQTGEGIENLIEHLSTLAELLELKADPTGPASGLVIEARQDSNRGSIADVMVQEGTLKISDIITVGRACGRVRAIFDDTGRSIEQAGPSTPVEILGLDEVPEAGEKLFVVETQQIAKEIAEEKRLEDRESDWTAAPKVTLENIFEQVEAGQTKQLNLVVRADTQGSVDVLKTKLEELSSQEIGVRILHAGTGGITEGDIVLADASGAIAIGFGVIGDDLARSKAQELDVQIKTYTVIYHLIEDITQALEGMLEPTYEQNVTARIEVRDTFKISHVGTIAGCYVTEGLVARSSKIRVIRENVIIREKASLDSLKRFKDDVREVRGGLECGLKITGFDDIKQGDIIEAYEIVSVARRLQPTTGGKSTVGK